MAYHPNTRVYGVSFTGIPFPVYGTVFPTSTTLRSPRLSPFSVAFLVFNCLPFLSHLHLEWSVLGAGFFLGHGQMLSFSYHYLPTYHHIHTEQVAVFTKWSVNQSALPGFSPVQKVRTNRFQTSFWTKVFIQGSCCLPLQLEAFYGTSGRTGTLSEIPQGTYIHVRNILKQRRIKVERSHFIRIQTWFQRERNEISLSIFLSLGSVAWAYILLVMNESHLFLLHFLFFFSSVVMVSVVILPSGKHISG